MFSFRYCGAVFFIVSLHSMLFPVVNFHHLFGNHIKAEAPFIH